MFLSSGGLYTSAIDENGIVYSWGNNNKNQLNIPEEYKKIKFVSISSGRYHKSAINENGIIYSWGSNKYHQLDIPSDYKKLNLFLLVLANNIHFVARSAQVQ